MAKMASLDAEQREIPWEWVIWRRIIVLAMVGYLLLFGVFIWIMVSLFIQISDTAVTALSTAITAMS
jgi:hypothetical protein